MAAMNTLTSSLKSLWRWQKSQPSLAVNPVGSTGGSLPCAPGLVVRDGQSCRQTTRVMLWVSLSTWKQKCLSSFFTTFVCVQSCPTVYNLVDCSPPGSSVHGISQARMLECGLPLPSPGDLPDPGIKAVFPMFPALAAKFFTTEPPQKPFNIFTLA